MNGRNYTDLLIELLARFHAAAKIGTKLGRNNTAIVAEQIAAELCTIILDTPFFKHTNTTNPGYDCHNKDQSILIQCSVTSDARKLNDAVEKLETSAAANAARFIFFIYGPKMANSKYVLTTTNKKKIAHTHFNAEQDIFDAVYIVRFTENTDENKRQQVFNCLDKYFGDNIETDETKIFYLSALLFPYSYKIQQTLYGFPVGYDFEKIWRFPGIEATICKKLEQYRKIYLSATYNRGKTTIARVIGKEYFEKGYSVIIINLLQGNEDMRRQVLMLSRKIIPSFKYFFIIENCHANDELFRLCESFFEDVKSKCDCYFLYTNRNAYAEEKMPLYTLNYSEEEIKPALKKAGYEDRGINGGLSLLGKQNPSLKLFYIFLKEFEKFKNYRFGGLAKVFKDQFDENIKKVCLAKNISHNYGISKLTGLARQNANDDVFIKEPEEKALVLFEELAGLGLLLSNRDAFQFHTVSDAKLYFFATGEGYKLFTEESEKAFNDSFGRLVSGDAVNEENAQQIFEIIKEKMPDSNTFNGHFFSLFDRFVKAHEHIAEALFSTNYGILSYYYLFKLKTEKKYLEFITAHYNGFIKNNRNAIVNANLVTIEFMLVLGHLICNNRNFFLDKLNITVDEAKGIVTKMPFKKGLYRIAKYLSGYPDVKTMIDEKFPLKPDNLVQGNCDSVTDEATSVITSAMLTGDFNNQYTAANLYKNLLSHDKLCIKRISIAKLGALLGIALFYFPKDYRTGTLFESVFNFALENETEIKAKTTEHTIKLFLDKFTRFGNAQYISKLTAVFQG